MSKFVSLSDYINENVQQAKSILGKNDIEQDDPGYLQLKRLVEKTPGLLGKFTQWRFSGTPFWKLRNAYQNFLESKAKGIKLANIESFNSFSEFSDSLINSFETQWEGQFSSGIKKEVISLFNDEIWKLIKDTKSEDDAIPAAVLYIKKFLQLHGRRYKSSGELYDVIKTELMTFRDITKKEYSEFFLNFDNNDAEIIYEDGGNLLVDIKTFKAMNSAEENHILSQSYCFGTEEVWNNLIGSEDNVQQFFWFNFDFDFQDEEFLITFTYVDNEVTRLGTRYGEIQDMEDWEEFKVIVDDFISEKI